MNDQVEETVVDNDVEETAFEGTAEEQKAMEGGWRPEAEWEGDPEAWVDAKTFNMRGELMDRIKSQTSQLRGQDKKIDRLEKSIRALTDHNKKMDEIAYKKAMNELKSLKREAFETSDYDKLEAVESQMEELKDAHTSSFDDDNQDEGGQSPDESVNPEVVKWVQENSWYSENTMLRGAADAYAAHIVQENPALKDSPEEVLKLVTKEIRQQFPDKFGGTRRKPGQTVSEPGDGAARSKGSAKKYSARHLNSTQREIGQTFVQTGAMKNLDEYAAQLAEIGELDIQKG